MDQSNSYQIREVRIEDGARLGDLYWNGAELYLIIKIRSKVYTIPVNYLIKELTRDLPSGVPAPTF